MKKMFLFLILFFTLSTVLTADWYYIGSSSSVIINVREFPNNQSRVVTTARNNEIIRVIHKQGNWYKVNIEAGDIGYLGYIHNSLLKPVTERNVLPNGNTNVRAAGSLKSKVIGKVNSEDVIYTIGNKNKGWYHVRLSKYQANGKKFGYIHESRFQD